MFANAQPETFQSRRGFVKLGTGINILSKTQRKAAQGNILVFFFSYVILKLHFKWKV